MGSKNKEPHHPSSGSKKRGFSLLKKKEDGSFFFRFYNEDGDLLLTSPPFIDEEKRKRSIKLIRKNAANLARFKRITEEDLHYFIVRAGNNKALAKSVGFKSKEAREKAINQLHRAVVAKPQEVPKTKRQTPLEPNPTETQATVAQSRFNFDLTFYLQEKGEKLIGKIEYPLDKEKISFEGFDMQRIQAFILEHLPPQVKAMQKTKAAIEELGAKEEVSDKNPAETKIPVQTTEPKQAEVTPTELPKQPSKQNGDQKIARAAHLQLTMMENSQAVTTNVIRKSAAISFQVDIPAEFHDPDYQIEVTVHAQLMKGGSRMIFIGKKRTFAPSLETQHLRVPLTIYSLAPGVHRCLVKVKFIHPDSPSKNRVLTGKKIVKIVEKESLLELALN